MTAAATKPACDVRGDNGTIQLASASLVGAGLDILGVPMYAPPPKPGNFTLPIPWLFLLPIIQAVTFGPLTGVLIGVVEKSRRPPRFSLRTLLIATTLVAGVLGLGVWMTR